MSLRIYGHMASINVRKVLWLCEELGLRFVQEDWGGLHRSTAGPPFASLTPVGLVPVIDHDGVIVWESNVILRYLAGVHRRDDLLPPEPAHRARVESWMDWQGSDFNNSWRVAFQGLVRNNFDHLDAEAIQRSCTALTRSVEIVDDWLRTSGGFVAGPAFTLADIPIGLSIHRWKSIPAPRPDLREVEGYYNRLCERTGFRKFGRDGGP